DSSSKFFRGWTRTIDSHRTNFGAWPRIECFAAAECDVPRQRRLVSCFDIDLRWQLHPEQESALRNPRHRIFRKVFLNQFCSEFATLSVQGFKVLEVRIEIGDFQISSKCDLAQCRRMHVLLAFQLCEPIGVSSRYANSNPDSRCDGF